MNNKTIRGDRLHIAFFGKRNAGKSSLINAITGQKVAIVSAVAGTTTDPVYKSMELTSVGPVVLIDTAGIDETDNELGHLRKERTEKILKKTDLALLTVESGSGDFSYENELISLFKERKISYILVINKIDLDLSGPLRKWLREKSFVRVSALSGKGIGELKKRILEIAPREWEPPFLRDLIQPGEMVALVTPIDLGAPKGRLIMPQVKALRDVLDGDAMPIMCKERELIPTLRMLKRPPALVVTDSQVFPQVAADVPPELLLTSFSILSIRQKGDLNQMVKGVLAVKNLKPGDPVLIAESCTHHPLEDDIGRIKIPRWLRDYVGGELNIETVPGYEYPQDLDKYKLIVHCGACTLNRREMLHRQEIAADLQVPITNYGVLISYLKNVFPRALKPFPQLYNLFRSKGEKEIENRIKRQMAKLMD